MSLIKDIINKPSFTKDDLISLLSAQNEDKQLIYSTAAETKTKFVGNKVYFRGLVEFSNKCRKNCLYCGIRSGNSKIKRYELTEDEVLEAVKFAYENDYGSIVIQAGERNDRQFIDTIANILKKINKISKGKLGITLSLGEQTEETYRKWMEYGAHRYLLRIETSNRELYKKLHPDDNNHRFDIRLKCLQLLQKIGYQTGTGVMIGLPFQSIEHLAEDLLFFKEFDIVMVGMGPYIEHENTPLFQYKDQLISKTERFNLSLKMIAILRIMMKDINIAATTAMQTLDPAGREKALKVGANIIMPNLTPVKYRESYLLYQNKPCIDEEASDCINCLEARIKIAGDEIGYGDWGDSKHFKKKKEDRES
jgi:biotin synthase